MNKTFLAFSFINSYINNINKSVREFGFQEGMKKIGERYHAKIEVAGLTPETQKILKQYSVLISANHPYELETIALIASLPQREDACLIVNAEFMGVCESLDKYLIPVYIKHHYGKSKVPLYRKLSGKIIKFFYPTTTLSSEEEHRKNIRSINSVSKRINNGGLVMIFPERHGPNGK